MNGKHDSARRWIPLLVTMLIAGTMLVGCDKTEGDANILRIAAVGPENRIEGEFKNGVTMAIEEVNQTDLLDGKTIAIDYFDDKRDLTTGIKIAQELSGQVGKYSAVIGHWNASINIPAADIYEKAGLLALSPMVSSPELTAEPKEYIFRAVPTDADEASRIAGYAAEKGYQKIAVCYTDSDYGTGLCSAFETAAQLNGIEIIDTHVSFVNQQEFDAQYEKWVALDVQAVFLADSLPGAVEVINQIREKNPTLPILSAGGFSFDDVVSLVGDASNQIAYVALYYPDQTLESQTAFNTKYKSLYGEEPASILAAKGYECVMLLADAAKATGSTASKELAGYLHTMEPWQGVNGQYTFAENGDPQGMPLYVVEVNNGAYTYL